MAKLSSEAKVAITILAALVVAFIGFRMMKDMPIFRQSQQVITYFNKVDGLTTGNYVFVNGVKVGSVKDIELVSNDSVQVTMNFDLNIEIPKGSVAYLESSGLLDAKTIVVERGDAKENVEYGGEIKGVYRGGMLESLKNEGEKLSGDVSESFEKLNSLLEELNNVVEEDNRTKINQMIENLRGTSDEIAALMQSKRSDLESGIDHANDFLANLDTVSTENKGRIDSAMAGLDRSLTHLEQLSGDLKQTNGKLDAILGKINNGEGSLGKLINNPSLYNNIDSLSAEMKTLIKNINKDPGKYLKHMRLIEVF